MQLLVFSLLHNLFQDLIKNNRMNRKPSESVEENEDDDDADMEVEEVDSDEWDEGDGEGEPGMHNWIHWSNGVISGTVAQSVSTAR